MSLGEEFEKLQDLPPNPRPGFESDIISAVKAFVARLPTGTAELTVSRVPSHAEWPEPHFAVTPRNPKAAPFAGTAVVTDLNLTVGHSWREFYGFARGGTVMPRATWQDELRLILEAIIAGQFTECLSLDATGAVVAWDSKLIVDGKEVVFRNGRRRKLGAHDEPRGETVTYESYVLR
jgi:hypothetical protein